MAPPRLGVPPPPPPLFLPRLEQNTLRELSEDEESAQHAYCSHDDVRNLPCMQGETLIAIKAPSGTTLEVPDPDEGMVPPNRCAHGGRAVGCAQLGRTTCRSTQSAGRHAPTRICAACVPHACGKRA